MMQSLPICITFVTLLSPILCEIPIDLFTVYEWKELEYEFPTIAERQSAIANGNYVHGNGVPIDVDVDYNEQGESRIFTTIPRFLKGIPFSLATVTNGVGNSGPILKAYPSYSWHSSHGTDCDGITSVFLVAIDACKRLWVLDTGRVDATQHCPPQLLTFDLETDTLLQRYRFPETQYVSGKSLFISPIVDVRDPPPLGKCRNTKVYIADVEHHGLVVYDGETISSWRIENKLMYPNAEWSNVTVADESFDLMDGIFGMSVTPPSVGGERFLFFHTLSSPNEVSIPLSIIDNRDTWFNNSIALPDAFKIIGTRNIQSAAEAMDSRGNLYFGIMKPVAIMSWNILTPYNENQFKTISQSTEKLQFTSAMKIVRNLNGKEELWTLTPRFQKVVARTKNSNEINFRILACPLDELLKPTGTCGSRRRSQGSLLFRRAD